jgi:hypothetical protein
VGGEVLLDAVIGGGAAQVGDPAQYRPGPGYQPRDHYSSRDACLISPGRDERVPPLASGRFAVEPLWCGVFGGEREAAMKCAMSM